MSSSTRTVCPSLPPRPRRCPSRRPAPRWLQTNCARTTRPTKRSPATTLAYTSRSQARHIYVTCRALYLPCDARKRVALGAHLEAVEVAKGRLADAISALFQPALHRIEDLARHGGGGKLDEKMRERMQHDRART